MSAFYGFLSGVFQRNGAPVDVGFGIESFSFRF